MPNEQREMVEGWLRGEESAVRALFGVYFPRAVRIAALSGLTPDEAKDCAQECFVHAFERRAQLRDPQAFPLWFHRILTRRILDALGARSREREEPLDEASELAEDWQRQEPPRPETLAVDAELRAELWEYVQALPTHYRVPLVLRYYGDFSIREVADLLGAREGTVRVTLHRALGQLRTRIAHPPGREPLAPARTPATSIDRK
jgi:RNA polymerase sigma-70 factor (ECF subfamily)